MVLAVTAPVRQPTGPQIAQIISNSGLRTPKVRRNRANGYYTAEWCQAGLVQSVPPAAFFREKLETRFDGIRILNTQEVKASWRDGHPIIISLVHFEIIDNIREKSAVTSKPALALSPIMPFSLEKIQRSLILPSLLEAIQRGTTANLPFPQQPVALLPAHIPVRLSKRERLASRPTKILSSEILLGLPPQTTLVVNTLLSTSAAQWRGVGGEVNVAGGEVGGVLPNTQFLRQHGKSALIAKLKAEAAAAGAHAARHYRMVNPPIHFPTLAEMEQDANTITVHIEVPQDNSTL